MGRSMRDGISMHSIRPPCSSMTRRGQTRSCSGSAMPRGRASTPDARGRTRKRSTSWLHLSRGKRGSRVAFELFNLAGKRALVTGSSQGIGLAIARGLAEHGASVVLNGRDSGKLDTAAKSLAAGGHQVAVSCFDVTDVNAVRDGVAAIEQSIGPIDILVNNAGMQFRTPLEDFPAEKWEELLRTN